MLSEKLLKDLNEQVNFEFYSSYLYLAMASYAESIDLSGFSNFFKVQVQEELGHAMKIYDFIEKKDGIVTLEAIEKPQGKFDSVEDMFETAYKHEQFVTSRIYNLLDTATSEREHATISMLKWFVDEQVEEEDNFNTILKKIKRTKDNQAALFMLDDELAQRVYIAPTDTTNVN